MGEHVQHNNGTKMAPAPALGRPLASRPPPRPSDARTSTGRVHSPPVDRTTTTGMTCWNQQADLRHQQQHQQHQQQQRCASTVSRLPPSASPPLNQQPLRRSGVCVPALCPRYLRGKASNDTFLAVSFFLGPFHPALLALNAGLSSPSKAAHQLL